MPFEILEACAQAAHEREIPVHFDGARIWNATAASGVPVPEYTAHVDSMMFCLSKGLGSPAGSMLCGGAEFIEKARRLRKRFGGGLRQAGVLAACGIVSLNEMIDRLADDHATAKKLASALEDAGVFHIDLRTVETNILIFSPPERAAWTGTEFAKAAKEEGLLVTYMGDRSIRMVTHNDYSTDWIEATVERAKKAAEKVK